MYKIIGADGKEYGPAGLDQLRSWVAQGRVNAQTRIQPAEGGAWKPATEIPEVALLLKPLAVPPGPQGPPPILTPPKLPSRDSGLAVLSFVLGVCSFVVCLGVITGVPAVVCGHIARRRAARQPARYAGRGLALAGVVLGYLSVVVTLVVAAMVLPQVAKNRKPVVRKTGCENNLRQIALAFKVWALDHNDKFPFNESTNSGGSLELCTAGPDGFDTNAIAHFQIISNELGTPAFLVCPNDRAKHAASSFEALEPINVSYRLRTGTNVNTSSPQQILAVCPVHGNEVYCNGEVHRTAIK